MSSAQSRSVVGESSPSWLSCVVRCSACLHAVTSSGRGGTPVVQCGVFSDVRSGEQSRICFEYEARP